MLQGETKLVDNCLENWQLEWKTSTVTTKEKPNNDM